MGQEVGEELVASLAAHARAGPRAPQRAHLVEDALGHLALRGEGDVHPAPVAPQEDDGVRVAAEAGARGGHVVGHDEVEALRLELLPRVGDEVLRLRREPDEDAPALRLAEPLQDVGGADELERHRAVRLLELRGARRGGPVVADRGRRDDHGGRTHAVGHRPLHLLRRAHGHHLDAVGGRQARRPRDEDHPRPPVARRLREAVAHLPRRAVRDEPHRVDVLDGGAGGDEHGLALEVAAAGEGGHRRVHDLADLREPALAEPPAGQVAAPRLHDAHPPGPQGREVLLHRGVLEHVHVHRRRHEHRRPRRQVERAERVVGDSPRELPEDVRGGRRHQQQVRLVGERDVADVAVHPQRPLVVEDRVPREGLERHRGHEARGGRGHHHAHVHVPPLQLAQDLAGLVGPDAPRDAEDDDRHRRYSSAGPSPAGAEILADLPRDGLRDRLLDRDARGLAAAGVDPRLGPGLQLLGPLRRDRDEAELGIHALGKDHLGHAVSHSFAFSKVLSMARARSRTTATRQRAARTMLFSSSTQASRSSLTIA